MLEKHGGPSVIPSHDAEIVEPQARELARITILVNSGFKGRDLDSVFLVESD